MSIRKNIIIVQQNNAGSRRAENRCLWWAVAGTLLTLAGLTAYLFYPRAAATHTAYNTLASLPTLSKPVHIDYNTSLPVAVSTDNRCGPFVIGGVLTNTVCPGNECCAVHQYCGTAIDYCLGCWPGFGLCGKNPIFGRPASEPLPTSPDPWSTNPSAQGSVVAGFNPCLNPLVDRCEIPEQACCVSPGDDKGYDKFAWKFTCRPKGTDECAFYTDILQNNDPVAPKGPLFGTTSAPASVTSSVASASTISPAASTSAQSTLGPAATGVSGTASSTSSSTASPSSAATTSPSGVNSSLPPSLSFVLLVLSAARIVV
ncbi:hypothetical protein HDV03_005034 [Kappamyces sp. JEL0829]|nr:hypothetical protein HDV03_005034 [Kappamyces sp. JEL0829]